MTGLSQRYLAALGRVTVAFQMTEHHLSSALQLLLSPDRISGQIVTAELRFQGLLSVLEALYLQRVHDAPRRAKVVRLLKRASDAEGHRNRLIHSLWVGGRDERYRPFRLKITVKRSKGLRFDTEDVPLRTLINLAEELESIAYDAIDLENELLEEFGDR